MQLLIDTDTDKVATLFAAAKMINDIAGQRAGGKVEKVGSQLANLPIPEHLLKGTPFADVVRVDTSGTAIVPPPPAGILTTEGTIPNFSENDIDIETDGVSATVTLTAPPPPPPVPAEPTVPAPVPAPPGAVPEYDAKGYPWDARIHASNRAQKLDKTWKYKRGVDANLIVAVEAQIKPSAPVPVVMSAAEAQAANFGRALRADSSPSAPVSTDSTASVPPPPPPPPPPVPSQDSTGSVPTPPTVAATSTPTASPPTSTVDFRGLMIKIQQSKASGKLSDEQVAAAMDAIGLKLEDMALLIGNAALIASVNTALDKCLTP